MRNWSGAHFARGLAGGAIVLKTETPLTKTEAIQALQAVLALNGIAVINVGDKFVKVLPVGSGGHGGRGVQRHAMQTSCRTWDRM